MTLCGELCDACSCQHGFAVASRTPSSGQVAVAVFKNGGVIDDKALLAAYASPSFDSAHDQCIVKGSLYS